jgi:hypothetical protein
MPIGGVSGTEGYVHVPPNGINQSQSQSGTNLNQKQRQQTDSISNSMLMGSGKDMSLTIIGAAAPTAREPGAILHVIV